VGCDSVTKFEDEVKKQKHQTHSNENLVLTIKSVDKGAILDLHYSTSFNSVVPEDSGLLGCDAASLGKRFVIFSSDF
jgi:hypothetical protein